MVKQSFWVLFFIFFSLIMLFPFILMLITSLKTLQEINSPIFTFFPHKLMFSNYLNAMKEGAWGRYFYNSFVVTTITVLFALVFNSMAGYAFSRLHFPGRDVLFFSILIGIMVPAQVIMVPEFLILKHFPLFGGNGVWGNGGTGMINTYAGLIIPFTSGSIGIFLCRQFFMNFPRALDQAASIDGASKFRIFLQIYLPLSKPLLATLAITKTTATWNDYIWPLIMTNTDRMMTVQLALTVFRSENSVQWNLLMAATTLVVVPLMVVFFLFQRYFVQGLVTSGLKG